MNCPYCGNPNNKVLDSRASDKSIRRRRECLNCGKRFTTFETVVGSTIFVVKKNGSKQPFDMDKLKKSIIKATEKRPVSLEKIDEIVQDVKSTIENSNQKEISSKQIAGFVMTKLKDADLVSYIRYALLAKEVNSLGEIKMLINLI